MHALKRFVQASALYVQMDGRNESKEFFLLLWMIFFPSIFIAHHILSKGRSSVEHRDRISARICMAAGSRFFEAAPAYPERGDSYQLNPFCRPRREACIGINVAIFHALSVGQGEKCQINGDN